MNFNDVENDQTAQDLLREIFIPWVALGNEVKQEQINALKASINRCHEADKGIAVANDELLIKLRGASNTAANAPAPDALIRKVADVIVLGHIWMHRVRTKAFNVAMARSRIITYIGEILDDALRGRNAVRGLGGDDGCEDCSDCQCSSGGCSSGGCSGHGP